MQFHTVFVLQGIAIGNGILSFSLMTIAKARFVEGFGLSGENSHQVFQRCCPNCLEKCPIHQKMWEDDACMTAVSPFFVFLGLKSLAEV